MMHAGVALGATVVFGGLGLLSGWPWLVWVGALLSILTFYFREGIHQQRGVNKPEGMGIAPWTWGPNGQREFWWPLGVALVTAVVWTIVL